MSAELCITPISGVFELTSSPHVDSRGAFFNIYRAQDESFRNSWGCRGISQVNLSISEAVGTIRGLHLQASPHSEAKLVSCLKGRVWDVAVDLRIGSSTYGKWYAVELTPELGNALLIPEGCAHGFQGLATCSQLLYLHSGNWVPDAETGVRWDDPSLAIPWPFPVSQVSERDRDLPFLPL